MRIRAARGEDSEVLTKIVRASSAYSGEYCGIIRDLTVSSAYIARETVYVCDKDGRIAGFYSLIPHGDGLELDLMFVSDEFRGLSVGRTLFYHMREIAGKLAYETVTIVAHPPAEAFYRRMGAVTVGIKPPSGRASWARPVMELRV